jgi:hypothetical protein
LYGFETWFLKFRGENRMVFENGVLRKIFGPTRDEVTGEWGRLDLHNEELYDMYPSPKIIRVIILSWEGHVARMGERRGAHRIVVEKSEGKRT